MHNTSFDTIATVREFDLAEVLNLQSPTGFLLKGYDTPNEYVPSQNPNYFFRQDVLRDVLAWLAAPYMEGLYLTGPTGSGKTSLICELGARLNYPVFQVTGHGRLEVGDLVGHVSLSEKGMNYQYGPLALAMKQGGLFVLDEIDLLDPSTAAGLNGVLEGKPLIIPENGGEIIKPHPMFRMIATANSNGNDDETGMYRGVHCQNMAFMDRFFVSFVDYPSKEDELVLVKAAVPSLPEDLLGKMIDFANDVRNCFTGQNPVEGNFGSLQSIEVTFSSRSLLRWAKWTASFQSLAKVNIQPIVYAFDRAMGFRASTQTRLALHELMQRYFPVE